MADKEKPSYYAIIPADVRYDTELKANEKLLYSEITALTNKTGECWASNKYFSDLYSVTSQAISKWLLNLQNKHYINIEYVYYFQSPIEVVVSDIAQKIAEETDKKVYEAFGKVGININEKELAKALQYDRRQYEKGYTDGVLSERKKYEEIFSVILYLVSYPHPDEINIADVKEHLGLE